MGGFLGKARDWAEQHDKQVDEALEKAGDFIDKRTGGGHAEQIDKAVQEAQKRTGDGDEVP
ncbi:MAG TPA: antitoxin [Mycobacteriales bacterium]|nr:antitoxin [Mycobacteriales bacterium]